MKYNFDEIIDRKNSEFSFSAKWQGPGYILKSLGVDEKKMRKDTICLETADMDFKVAPEITEDLMKVIEHGIFGYSSINRKYKEAVCAWYKNRQNWEFEPEDIIYFPGTHEAVAQCVLRYTAPGEGVIVMTPCYGYHSDIDANNRKYVTVDMLNDGNEYYSIDFDAFEKACMDTNNTMFVLCHPHNPTGRVFNNEELTKIAGICRKNKVLIVSDEVHSDILRKGQGFEPMMKVCGPEGIISCTAVNKTFNLAGLAMTNVIVKDPALKAKLENYFVLPSPFGIQAVISAYTRGEAWVDALNMYIDNNIKSCLDYIWKNLPKVKVGIPEGGYSIYLDFSDYGFSDDDLIDRIYNKAGIVLNSGLFFDDKRGKQVHRACLSSPEAMCIEALERIAKAIN